MKNNLMFVANELNADFIMKSNIEEGDILKRKSDNLFYRYKGTCTADGINQIKEDTVFADFFGFIVSQAQLKKFFCMEKKDFMIYSVKEK